jgi:1-acyl-sn-glycerol-3-phosphate acyltransferase
MNGNPIYASCQVLARILTTLLLDLKVSGAQHVPRTGGVLIASNHQSLLDPVLVGVHLPRPTSFLAKSQLFENPRFAWLIQTLYAFPVRQGEGDIGAVREAIKQLQDGRAVVLFPEGSRTENGELLPIEPGVGLIARKAAVPVVPCVVEGSFEAWPKHSRIFRPRPIGVKFGPPMIVGHQKAAVVVKALDAELHRLQAELRREMTERSRQKWTR